MNIINVNNSFASLFRKSKKNIIGSNLRKALNEYGELLDQIEDLHKNKETSYKEYFEPQLNKWFLISHLVEKVENERFHSIQLKDFTEIHRDEEYHSMFFNNSQAFVYIQNKENSYISDNFHKITGLNKTWFDNNINRIQETSEEKKFDSLRIYTIKTHNTTKEFIYCAVESNLKHKIYIFYKK